VGWLGGRLRLEEEIREQVTRLVQDGSIAEPGLHLDAWLMCRKLQGGSETRVLPDAGGALDQNAELTWAFGIIEDQYAQETELKKNFAERSAKNEELRQSLIRQRG
jgi:hypothetical protein